MKFSIIVPVYNVKDYLDQCMDSLLNQTYSDYEILLIDDGSTDGSGDQCDTYSIYEQVRVFHKPNGGLSDARNFGIERADGEYLVFVDSDDWIEKQSLEKFVESLGSDRPDVLITRLIESFDDGKQEVEKDEGFYAYLQAESFSKERAIQWDCWQSKSSFPAPKKIISKDLIEHYQLRFLKGKLHEDIDWSCNIWYNAETYSGCTFAWYHHRMGREGAITASINKKHYFDMIQIAAIHFKGKNKDDIHRQAYARIMGTLYAWLRYTRQLNEEDIKAIADYIDDNEMVFSVAPGFKHKLFCLSRKIIGTRNTLKLVNFCF